MKNKEKILIALASFSFFLIVYLVIASKEIKVPKAEVAKEQVKTEKVDLAVLKTTYQDSVRNIYSRLKDDSESNNKEIDINKELLSIKDGMMSLVVPEEYKTFHMSLIMLIDGVINNNFVLDDNFQKKLNKIGQDNSWLN